MAQRMKTDLMTVGMATAQEDTMAQVGSKMSQRMRQMNCSKNQNQRMNGLENENREWLKE